MKLKNQVKNDVVKTEIVLKEIVDEKKIVLKEIVLKEIVLKEIADDKEIVDEKIQIKESGKINNKLSLKSLKKIMPIDKWVKILPMETLIPFEKFMGDQRLKIRSGIVKVADIVIDKSQKRNSMIEFKSVIEKEKFVKKSEWIYLFTIDQKIVKIGGTRNGIQQRSISYLTGHHTKERGKSGYCSNTNAYLYNTFIHYLLKEQPVEMYGYELPENKITIEIFGELREFSVQTYHAYEAFFLSDFKKKYKSFPPLSDNCDPDYVE